ncbi:HAD-IA family hydrolase [Treponema phagedenis]|uniref:HAD-IA family hydrolase n=1 Tax=Treponema phagedenis TaxID=162 RepID=UPI0002D79794|nr:HAD-IA family hydrolase [Treponema phagedenis]
MIKHLLFDMDNTLYSCTNKIDEAIGKRMIQFAADFLNTTYEHAKELRKTEKIKYVTTLQWLKLGYGFKDDDAYFNAVHPEYEINELEPDPNLRSFLLALNMPMTVLTNAPMMHAERVLKFFNIYDIFLGIFDISFHNGNGKPHPDCFYNTLKQVNKTVEETLFLDDYPHYLLGFKNIGGRIALIDEKNKYEDFAKEHSIPVLKTIYELPKLLETINN